MNLDAATLFYREYKAMATEPGCTFRVRSLYHQIGPMSRSNSSVSVSGNALCTLSAGFYHDVTSIVDNAPTACTPYWPHGIIEAQDRVRQISADARLSAPCCAEVVT